MWSVLVEIPRQTFKSYTFWSMKYYIWIVTGVLGTTYAVYKHSQPWPGFTEAKPLHNTQTHFWSSSLMEYRVLCVGDIMHRESCKIMDCHFFHWIINAKVHILHLYNVCVFFLPTCICTLNCSGASSWACVCSNRILYMKFTWAFGEMTHINLIKLLTTAHMYVLP